MGYIKFDKPIQTQNGGVGEEGCKMKGFMSTLLVLLLSFLCPAFCATYYVPDDFPTIQAAIEAASNGDEIIVRPGTYYENINFLGKAIYLHSEQGPDVTIIDGQQNSCVVAFENGEGRDSIIEGFTITNGYVRYAEGGGIYCNNHSSPTITKNVIYGNSAMVGGGISCYYYSSPTIKNNVIYDNSAYYFGGGILCRENSSPVIENNVIYGNWADKSGGGISCSGYSSPMITNNVIYGNGAYFGGGIHCSSYSSPTIENNVIYGNWADKSGGGISCSGYSSSMITSNVIYDNSAAREGGGIYCYDHSSPTITKNVISGNSADGRGGGILCLWGSSPTIINNVIYDNSTDGYGGGIYCHDYSSPTITNNVISGNSASRNGGGIYCLEESYPTITYCDFYNNEGGNFYNCSPGEGCIFEEPMFTNPDSNDYRLRASSPCRDAGDPSILDPDGTRSDMGAYGGPDADWQSWIASFYPGWNLVSVSTAKCPYGYADGAFYNLVDNGNVIENSLYAYSPSLGYLVYPADFTDVAPGIGYWLFITNPGDYIISGQELREDFSITLSSGWNLLGHPFLEPVLLSSCMVKHPTEGLVPIEEAVNNGWLALPFYKYIPGLGYRVVSYNEPYDDDHLRPWTGYWVFATVDNLKLIIPYPTE